MDFHSLYPSVIYEVEDERVEAFAPAIPVRDDGSTGLPVDVQRLGAYPDHLVRSVARQRDRVEKKLGETTAELKREKKHVTEQVRLADMWRERYVLSEAKNRRSPVLSVGEGSGKSVRTDSEDNLLNGAMD